MLNLDKIFSGKIRIQLLTRLLLNPTSLVYLRGLERELGVSSNTVRLELNKLTAMKLINPENPSSETSTKTKKFKVDEKHPLFSSLRRIVLQYTGLDKIVVGLIEKLGKVENVYLTGDLAQGKNSPFIDLVIVGDIDRSYLNKLIEKTEKLIDKKIRVGLFNSKEFTKDKLKELGVCMKLIG